MEKKVVPWDRKADHKQNLDFMKDFEDILLKQSSQYSSGVDVKFEIEVQILKEVAVLSEGKSFGELALVTDKPRMATCNVKEGVAWLATLEKNDYNSIIGQVFRLKMRAITECMNYFPMFQKLSKRTQSNLFYYFKPMKFKRNQYLFKEGDPISSVYLLINGTV